VPAYGTYNDDDLSGTGAPYSANHLSQGFVMSL